MEVFLFIFICLSYQTSIVYISHLPTKIKEFLYRAFYNDKRILFVIANMEYLSLSITQRIIRSLRKLYKSKNRNIKSYLIFILL